MLENMKHQRGFFSSKGEEKQLEIKVNKFVSLECVLKRVKSEGSKSDQRFILFAINL
jgi:hypothetical protein